MSQKRIKTVGYLFIDVLDGVIETPELKHAVKRPFRAMQQGQQNGPIQRKKLVKQITAHRVEPAFWPSSVQPI